jgi:hypothetical protein
MKSNIHKHLFGIYKALKVRIDNINNSIGHNLTKGQENEIIIQKLLLDFLPKNKYDLSTGIIIGTDGNESKQNDIVILDKNHPNYTFSSDSRLHLADHVLATIEVKTTFDRKALKEALKNIETVKKIQVSKSKWREMRTIVKENSENKGLLYDEDTNCFWQEFEPTVPIGIIFFYSVKNSKSAHNVDDYFKMLNEELSNIDWKYQPDLIFNLGNATWFRYTSFPRIKDSGEFNITLLTDAKNKDNALFFEHENINNQTIQMVNFGNVDLEMNVGELQGTVITDLKGRSNILAFVGESFNIDPLTYPSCKIKGKIYYMDVYRSFLQFMQMVNNYLLIPTSNKNWNLSDYLGEDYLKGAGYTKEKGIE